MLNRSALGLHQVEADLRQTNEERERKRAEDAAQASAASAKRIVELEAELSSFRNSAAAQRPAYPVRETHTLAYHAARRQAEAASSQAASQAPPAPQATAQAPQGYAQAPQPPPHGHGYYQHQPPAPTYAAAPQAKVNAGFADPSVVIGASLDDQTSNKRRATELVNPAHRKPRFFHDKVPRGTPIDYFTEEEAEKGPDHKPIRNFTVVASMDDEGPVRMTPHAKWLAMTVGAAMAAEHEVSENHSEAHHPLHWENCMRTLGATVPHVYDACRRNLGAQTSVVNFTDTQVKSIDAHFRRFSKQPLGEYRGTWDVPRSGLIGL
jgi:hypothetical protein